VFDSVAQDALPNYTNFAALLTGGLDTRQRRLQIVMAHRQRIVAGQQRLADCLDAVDAEISYYRRTERQES